AECSSRAGDDETTDFFIALTLFQYFQHFLVHLGNKGIERLRAIERDRSDAVLFFVENRFPVHGSTSLSVFVCFVSSLENFSPRRARRARRKDEILAAFELRLTLFEKGFHP